MSSTGRRVDSPALRDVLTDELGQAETFEVEEVEAGSGNDTYFVAWGDRELVLRRPPAEPAGPELLHDVLREYAVLDALEHTWVPTPAVALACEDASVIGDEFYLMERVVGSTYDEVPDDRFGADEQRAASAGIVDTLAKIHNIDADRVGLSDFGEPGNFIERRLELTIEQLDWAQERTAEVRELTALYEVADWLEDNVPEQRHRTLVHGDYRAGNLMLAPDGHPRIVGVLDWELSTIGDPMADLGWLLDFWTEAGDPSPVTDDLHDRFGDNDLFPALQESFSGSMVPDAYLTRREVIDRYEAQTGIAYADDRFHRALAALTVAAILDGLYRAYLEDSPSAKPMHAMMELLPASRAQKAKLVIDGEYPV